MDKSHLSAAEKRGPFEAKASHIFSKLMKYREEADYNPAYVFTDEDFVTLRQEVAELSDKVKALLKKKGHS